MSTSGGKKPDNGKDNKADPKANAAGAAVSKPVAPRAPTTFFEELQRKVFKKNQPNTRARFDAKITKKPGPGPGRGGGAASS